MVQGPLPKQICPMWVPLGVPLQVLPFLPETIRRVLFAFVPKKQLPLGWEPVRVRLFGPGRACQAFPAVVVPIKEPCYGTVIWPASVFRIVPLG